MKCDQAYNGDMEWGAETPGAVEATMVLNEGVYGRSAERAGHGRGGNEAVRGGPVREDT